MEKQTVSLCIRSPPTAIIYVDYGFADLLQSTNDVVFDFVFPDYFYKVCLFLVHNRIESDGGMCEFWPTN